MSDPTGYKTRKTEKTSSSNKKKRAMSAPVPYEHIPLEGDILDPAVIAYGKHNDTNVIVFGEIHNMIDNRFYENLNLRDNFVFVEHSSVLCDMTTEHKKKLLNILKGSEWIWYKYSSRKKPIVCLDNRIELGLPTSIEEKYALQSSDLEIVIGVVMKALRILVTNETKAKFVRALLTPTYTLAIKTIKEQMGILIQHSALNTDYLMDVKWKLIQNITKLSGMLVDINTMEHIKKYTEEQKSASKKKDIFLFMGAAHAYRLHKFFPTIFDKIKYNVDNPEIIESMETLIYE